MRAFILQRSTDYPTPLLRSSCSNHLSLKLSNMLAVYEMFALDTKAAEAEGFGPTRFSRQTRSVYSRHESS